MSDMVVDAPDNSGSSSNNSPWGGSSGNAGNGGGSSSSGGSGIKTLKSGDSYTTPWGTVTINSQGHPVMNGVVMTADNSSMVQDPTGGFTRVLNSLIGKPTTPQQNAGSKTTAQTVVENYIAGGSWAGTGPLDTSLINTAIVDALTSQMAVKPAPVTATKTYTYLRSAFDSLPFDSQPSARDQITQALQKFHDGMPDQVRSSYETGGKNGHTIVGTKPNAWKKKLAQVIPQITSDLNNALSQNEAAQVKDALLAAADLISGIGEPISEYAGETYKKIAKDISDAVRNFQGKTIRSFDDAMSSLNKITSNPGMKISQANKDALVNAWNHMSAQDMANKMGNFAKAFKTADIVLKVEKVKEKSVEGYQTGNWQPLILEVESWGLSTLFSGVSVALLASLLSTFTLSLTTTAVLTIAGLMLIAILASLIDDKVADAFNNAIVPSAH